MTSANASTHLDDDALDSIADPHQPDYDSIGGCVCGETYPCTTIGLVDEVRRLRDVNQRLAHAANEERSRLALADRRWRVAEERLDLAHESLPPLPTVDEMFADYIERNR